MEDEKIMDLCLLCVSEPKEECINHKDWVEEVYLSNVVETKSIKDTNN